MCLEVFLVLFLSASLSLISILSFISVLYPLSLSSDSTSPWFSPLSFHAFLLSRLRYPILLQLVVFATFSHKALFSYIYLATAVLGNNTFTGKRIN